MKKRCLCLMIPSLLFLTLTANAASVPGPNMEQAPLEVYSLDWFIAMEETYWRDARERYGAYHDDLQFFSSMGCDDICCTDPDHIHWCPRICTDPEHSHSEAEYHQARTQSHPPCPCHNSPAIPLAPEEEEAYWQAVREDWFSIMPFRPC